MTRADTLARVVLRMMGDANDVVFRPTREQRTRLVAGLEAMRRAGCPFTGDDLDLLVDGEERERRDRFRRYAGWTDVDRALEDVFNEEVDA